MSDTPRDITERLRALYVEHGTNYVQEAADEIERLRACFSDDSNKIAGMQEVINAFRRERDEALALLREAQEVLSRNWFTDSEGESYNNDDVIAMDGKITKFLEPK